MIKDRGTIKWTAMMLPEHVKALEKWKQRDHYTEKIELNEWDLQLIQNELELAYKRQCETIVKTWANGHVTERQGIVQEINSIKMFIVIGGSVEPKRINVRTIINVQSID